MDWDWKQQSKHWAAALAEHGDGDVVVTFFTFIKLFFILYFFGLACIILRVVLVCWIFLWVKFEGKDDLVEYGSEY